MKETDILLRDILHLTKQQTCDVKSLQKCTCDNLSQISESLKKIAEGIVEAIKKDDDDTCIGSWIDVGSGNNNPATLPEE